MEVAWYPSPGCPLTCTGSVSLAMGGSHIAGQSITYTTSGVTGTCTTTVHKTSCSGPAVSSPFTESVQGTYTYIACADKNNDGDYLDAGEQDSSTWDVGECDVNSDCVSGGYTCGPTYPSRYAECDNPSSNPAGPNDYKCDICGPCSFNSDCTAGNCCAYEGPLTTGNPGPGDTVNRDCVSTVRQPYLCTS